MGGTSAGNLKLNQRLELFVDEDPGKGRYASYVVDIAEDRITAAAPMSGNRIIALPAGTRLQVIYVDDSGVYGYPAQVTGKKRDTTPLLILVRCGPVEKVQRRNFVRLDISLPIRYIALSDKKNAGKVAPEENLSRPGRIIDISGGGIQIATSERMRLQTILQLDFQLPRGLRIQASGMIVRRLPAPATGKSQREYYYGIRFEGLPALIQDELVKHIFAEQMLLRRKGLL
ncbi:MAG: flagellar brake protein [bacterium]|jgi:c-di-GMP-binding flagellar brake protein YcgR